jgi:DNA-binding response OmpR family regulator
LKIAVLEDDQSMAKMISIFLESADHSSETFNTGEIFIDRVQQNDFDLFLLDWELPDTNGIEILKWIRKNIGWEKPVLFMTGRDSKEDIVTALENGADDYMVKPVDRQEFLARVNALVRRIAAADHQLDKLEFGEFMIHISDRKISRAGTNIDLTPKEYELAVMLFKSGGRLLPREEILKTIWGIEAEINTRTVDTHISRIRKKLLLEPGQGWRLSSIYHHGYRLEHLSE